MNCNDFKYKSYVSILKEELVPAMGCTEPIAIAYGASIVKDYLKCLPNEVDVYVSGNILKNVKSVTVPNTGGMQGIDVACAIGLIGGKTSKKLEVISEITQDQITELKSYLDKTSIKVFHSDNESVLYIEIIGKSSSDTVKVIIKDAHTNVTLIEKNGEVIYKNEEVILSNEVKTDKSVLSIKDIVEFIETSKK